MEDQIVKTLDSEERNKIYDRCARRDDGTHSGAYYTDFSIEKLLKEQEFIMSPDHF